MNPLVYEEVVKQALLEDLGFDDLTTEAVVSPNHFSTAEITAKEDGVICGLEAAATAFRLLEPGIDFSALAQDGDKVKAGQIVVTIKGRTKTLLSGERTALNFLQRLSGIATSTRRAVDMVNGYNCKIVDTRKTTPGLRALEKYAVKAGGGSNHRFGLFDAVLIKDNHIIAAGGISEAVLKVRASVGHMVKVEVEAETLAQVEEALGAGADVIMLDNMSLDLMREAVKVVGGRALTEASGGITLESLKQVAQTGVDLISLGWLTHSSPALDLSLNLRKKLA